MPLTPKMHKIADAIGNVIYDNYAEDYLTLLFSNGIIVEDVIFQVLVLSCRYAYLSTAEKHPLKYFIDKDGLDLETTRKELKRVFDYLFSRYTMYFKPLIRIRIGPIIRSNLSGKCII